ESVLARRCVLQGQARSLRALALLLGCLLAQFLGAVHDATGMRMFGLPSSKALKKTVHVVTGFSGELVFHLPEVFKDRIRFHTRSLPLVQEVCKPSVISSP